MATTKKQTQFHYVLVMTDEGPKFVTGLGEHHTAYWNELEAPKELAKEWADDMVIGLTWNGHLAFHVVSKFEIEKQPFRYNIGHFEWKFNKDDENLRGDEEV